MAKQHFYSRVPAKMSIFNRMDSYDTFAHSENLSREFIEKELAKIYDNKPTKDDAALMSEGALPGAYVYYNAADGTAVESAVSYLENDYTGERSTYFVHSLVLSEEETKSRFDSLDSPVLSSDDFKKDFEGFNIESTDTRYNKNYPELSLKAKTEVNTESLLEKYDVGMLKRLIYALLSVACGKSKALFLTHNTPIKSFSEESLSLLNGILGIFPYNVKRALTFVTYAGDFSKFSCVKIKCMPEKYPTAPTSKGVTLKMSSREAIGLSDETIAANAAVVDFFYELISKKAVRKDFVEFFNYAVEKNPALNKPTLKNITDSVLLFRVLSPYYDEEKVLPNDDAVYEFVTVYDKYRSYILDEYRKDALKCTKRYTEKHTPIPKNVFNKISNLYKTEPVGSKYTFMSVSLDLIHTDVMRDKLFNFIKSNYQNEADETKEVIMQDLARVYYGGFLQPQILDFFAENFESEPFGIRKIILEKVFLTIRTPAIQGKVLEFADRFYNNFSDNEKNLFYETFFENLPEGDDLAVELSKLVNKYIEDERKEAVKAEIIKILEKDNRKKEPKICEKLSGENGFTSSVIAEKVFTDWCDKKAMITFTAALCKGSFESVCNGILSVWQTVPDMSEKASENFLKALKENINISNKTDIFLAIEYRDKFIELSKNTAAKSFAQGFNAEIAEKLVKENFNNIFDVKRYPDGIEKIVELAGERQFIKNCDGYKNVTECIKAAEAVLKSDCAEAFAHGAKIVGSEAANGAAEYIKAESEKCELSCDLTATATLVCDYIRHREIKISRAVEFIRGIRKNEIPQKKGKRAAEKAKDMLEEKVAETLITLCSEIYGADIPEELKLSMFSEGSELLKFLNTFGVNYRRKAKKLAAQTLAHINSEDEYKNKVTEAVNVKIKKRKLFSK